MLHCAVLGPVRDEQDKIIEYLIRTYPASLETKSNAGYTPLFLAFLLGRFQFAKTLIDAGADICVKDKSYNNLIHAALTNNPKKPDMLRQLLELLEPDMRNHMFMQRNGLAHGGDTPLHAWLQNANPLNYSYQYNARYGSYRHEVGAENEANVNILKMIIDMSKGAELDILNSAGNTVLHTAVLRELPKQMVVIMEANPKLLLRENAVGRTPTEIAYDRYIHEKVSSLDPIEDNIVDVPDHTKKDPSHFLDNFRAGTKLYRTRRELTWAACAQHLASHEGSAKRRLVSLNEANDVAIRIGESYTGQRYFQKTPANPDEAEEEAEEEQEDEEAKKKREEEEARNTADMSTLTYYRIKNKAWACPNCGVNHA